MSTSDITLSQLDDKIQKLVTDRSREISGLIEKISLLREEINQIQYEYGREMDTLNAQRHVIAPDTAHISLILLREKLEQLDAMVDGGLWMADGGKIQKFLEQMQLVVTPGVPSSTPELDAIMVEIEPDFYSSDTGNLIVELLGLYKAWSWKL